MGNFDLTLIIVMLVCIVVLITCIVRSSMGYDHPFNLVCGILSASGIVASVLTGCLNEPPTYWHTGSFAYKLEHSNKFTIAVQVDFGTKHSTKDSKYLSATMDSIDKGISHILNENMKLNVQERILTNTLTNLKDSEYEYTDAYGELKRLEINNVYIDN